MIKLLVRLYAFLFSSGSMWNTRSITNGLLTWPTAHYGASKWYYYDKLKSSDGNLDLDTEHLLLLPSGCFYTAATASVRRRL